MTARRQWVKWAVYALLFLDYARAYVASIDFAAWLVLILLIDRIIHDWQPRERAGPLNPTLNASA